MSLYNLCEALFFVSGEVQCDEWKREISLLIEQYELGS